MFNIGNSLKLPERPQKAPRSEREELVGMFLERLNNARLGTKYKPLTGRAVAVKLSHIPTGDLWAFYQQCERANNFSAYFFWALNPNNHAGKM